MKLLKIPISFYKEADFDEYEESLYRSKQEDHEDEDEIDRMIRENLKGAQNTKDNLKEPKEYRTDLFIRKKDISSFHAAFLQNDSTELDATAIYTKNGQMYVCTLLADEFLERYKQY